MDDDQAGHERPISRRTLLKGGLLAAGALAGGGAALGDLLSSQLHGSRATDSRHGAGALGPSHGDGRSAQQGARTHPQGSAQGPYIGPPNILVIMVDQMRSPCWFSASHAAARLMPNIASIHSGGVSFESHYTASNDCSPARAAMLTGLYTHQTGCMITGGSTLDPGFPTWGTMLREQGYDTSWFGKWHLAHGDNHWREQIHGHALERYGFSGGTYPSPDGGPGQGWTVDPHIASQFQSWIAKAPSNRPWCTTVSFVNPHDIAWWYVWSDRFAAEASAPSIVREMPANFQTPEQMQRQRVPRLQLSHQETSSVSFGEVPFTGPRKLESWAPFFDLYLKLLHEVDGHIGTVLRALHSRPELAANTVVVFTSDHGEYGGSHGLRGKGGAVYEEAIRVPLVVKDLRGGEKLAAAPARRRTGLTSSVDLAPMLLSIATESDSWRNDSHYSHIANRHDMLAMLRQPQAPGRTHVLHASDEIVTEFAIRPYAADAPLHLTSIRTPTAKLALYSNWAHGSTEIQAAGQESELYDYRTRRGRTEVENRAGIDEALEASMRAKLDKTSAEELRQELPQRLRKAQHRGFADYHDTASDAAVAATARRDRLLERELEGRKLGGGLNRMLRRQYHRYARTGRSTTRHG